MGLSRIISEIDGDSSRKSQNFHTQCILRPRWRVPRWNWVSAQGFKNLAWWGYQMF